MTSWRRPPNNAGALNMDYPGKDADDAIQQNLSKVRFLQEEATTWWFPTKLIELLFAGGCLLLVGPFLVDEPAIEQLPYVGGIIMVTAYLELAKRRAIWSGWYFGYEQGFKDAAIANFDFWGESHDEYSDASAVEAVIERIKQAEETISEENIARRDKQIVDGLKLFQGFLIGWRRSAS
jgi:hypothetical protein